MNLMELEQMTDFEIEFALATKGLSPKEKIDMLEENEKWQTLKAE